MPSITVMVASPGRGGRKTCQDLLAGNPGVRVVGEARSGLQALAVVGALRPRVLLLDVELAQAGGRSLIPAIRQRNPGTRVIVLTRSEGDAQTLEALSLGARGCLAWDALPTFLVAAVRAVDAGEAWVPRKIVALLMDRLVALYASSVPRRSRAAAQGSA